MAGKEITARDRKLAGFVPVLRQIKDADEKEALSQDYLRSEELRKAVVLYLESRVDELLKKEESDERLDEAAWPYRMAGSVRERKALRSVINLLSST